MSYRDDLRRIYIGGLPSDVTRSELTEIFEKYGRINKIDLMDRREPIFAFIQFDRESEAREAVRDMDGRRLGRNTLRVEFPRGSTRSNRSTRPGPRTGYRAKIHDLPRSTSWQDLKDYFRKAGSISYADVLRDGTGIVEFERRDDLDYAVRNFDNTEIRTYRNDRGTIRVDYESSTRSRSRERNSRKRSYSRSPRRRSRSNSRRRYSRSRSPRDTSRKSRSESPDRKRPRRDSSSRSVSRSNQNERRLEEVSTKNSKKSYSRSPSRNSYSRSEDKRSNSKSNLKRSKSKTPESRPEHERSRSRTPESRPEHERSRSRTPDSRSQFKLSKSGTPESKSPSPALPSN